MEMIGVVTVIDLPDVGAVQAVASQETLQQRPKRVDVCDVVTGRAHERNLKFGLAEFRHRGYSVPLAAATAASASTLGPS
jgi:hypothetical protein